MELEILGMNIGCILGSLSAYQIPEKDCILAFVSKLLGYLIVVGSTTVKLPQIFVILKHNSVRGLSVAAFELEVVGYTIALSYCLHKGIAFSAYGELLFLLIQTIILVAIIYYYSQPLGAKTWMKAFLYCAVAPTVLSGQLNPVLFEALYASQHAIFFFARVPQIWGEFYYQKYWRTELYNKFYELCWICCKSFYEHRRKCTDEYLVILGSVLGIVTNGTILSQILIYRQPHAKKEKKVQ